MEWTNSNIYGGFIHVGTVLNTIYLSHCPWDRFYCYFHLVDEETEAHRGKESYLTSPCWYEVELRFEPLSGEPRVGILIMTLYSLSWRVLWKELSTRQSKGIITKFVTTPREVFKVSSLGTQWYLTNMDVFKPFCLVLRSYFISPSQGQNFKEDLVSDPP